MFELVFGKAKKYDLIASFLFGPLQSYRDRQFLREFYDAARVGIKPNGRILLTSDIGSFRYIEELAREGHGEVLRFPTFPHAYLGKKAEPIPNNISIDN